MTVTKVVKRYFLTGFFPVLFGTPVYLDWKRTQRYKAQQRLEEGSSTAK